MSGVAFISNISNCLRLIPERVGKSAFQSNDLCARSGLGVDVSRKPKRLWYIQALVAVFLLGVPVRAADDASAPAISTEASMAENLPTRRWDADKLRDLARNINTLPDEVAAAGLWLAASAPPRVDTLSIYANALSSPSPQVKVIAVSILAAQSTDDARRLLMNTLALEQNPDVIQAVVQGLSHLPRKRAVRGLVDIMFLSGASGMVTDSAAEELRRLTKADIGNSTVDWRDWWLDNEHLFD